MPRKPMNRCPKCKRRHGTGNGLCPDCRRARERIIDQQRGTATERGYGVEHRERFRAGVLRNDPWCVCEDPLHGHDLPCAEPSTRADHHPFGRRELVARGLDPNDPQYGRGLCASCDSRQTAQRQPGGWNRR